jgi:GR25 family glycosyltransferase involved in LPS biosynthesis
MRWTSFFDDIVVINLNKREDRLLQITEDFELYDIPFKRVPAIVHPKGAEGLKETMIWIFEAALQKNHEHILIFEDDCKFVVSKHDVDEVMSEVIKQLPETYVMCFLGCQLTGGVSHFVGSNVIAGKKMFSTHAVMYSKRGMKEILATGLSAPIDNHYVDKVEQIGGSYCTYPLLATQRAGVSDIGGNFINWDVFITPKFEQKVNEFRRR